MMSAKRYILLLIAITGFSIESGIANASIEQIPATALPVVAQALGHDNPDYHAQDRVVPSGANHYQFNNAAHQLSAGFGNDGVSIELTDNQIHNSKTGGALKLSPTGYGYVDAVLPVAENNEVIVNKNRIEYVYRDFSEWYINSPLGLEHGFTLNHPPGAKNNLFLDESNMLVVQLSYDSELAARIMPGNQGVQFVDRHGKALYRYSRLKAWDANGKILTTRMQVADSALALSVDVNHAVFPITVDPLFENETKLTASNGLASDFFGFSVDVDGEWMAISAYGADPSGIIGAGAVYTFQRVGAIWSQFVPEFGDGVLHGNFVADAKFGWDVAIRQTSSSGSPVLVVGARSEDAVYVYEFGWFCTDVDSGDYQCWGQKTRLVGSQVESNDQFGFSVDVDDDTIVVGALFDEGVSPATSGTGAAYVYRCNAILFGGFGPGGGYCADWSEEKQLLPAAGATIDSRFGHDVAIDNETIVVGSSRDDSVGGNAGAVYVFRRIVVGNTGVPFFTPIYDWVQEQKVTEGALTGDNLGYSVAVSGNELVAGAPYATTNAVDSGVVQVFTFSVGTWTLTDTLIPLQIDNTTFDGASGDEFGTSVDFVTSNYPGLNDYILVGASRNDDAGSDSGSAYLYQRDASSWVQINKLTASDAASSDIYGRAVAMDASSLVIGASGDDDNGNSSGSAYVYNAPAGTSIDLQLSSNSLDVGNASVTATVTLGVDSIAAPNALLAGRTVVLQTIDPNGVNGSINLVTNNNGVASVVTSFPVVGTWQVRASYAGDVTLEWAATSSSFQDVTVNAHAGYAVIIEGSRYADGSAQELSVQKSSDMVYQTLLARGFTNNHIYYFGQSLGGDVDALATNGDLNNYLLNTNPGDGPKSLLERSTEEAAPIHVFMVGQAQPGGVFYLNENNGPGGTPETMTVSQLDSMLDTLEVDPDMQLQPRTVTIATPYSGGFIPLLSSATPSGRIVVTSTTASGPAFKGPVEQDGIAPASLFLGEFMHRWAEGNDLRMSYQFAREQTAQISRADDSNLIAATQYVNNVLQKTLLDDNGDGVGSHRLGIGSVGGLVNDGALARSVYLGVGVTDSNDFQVSDTFYEPAGQTTVTVALDDEPGEPSDTWTIAVRNPGTVLSNVSSEEQLTLPLTSLGTILYEGAYYAQISTPLSGKYEVWYWGESFSTGRESLSKRSIVYVDNPGNLAPSAPVVDFPVSGETNIGTQFAIDWQPASDTDGDAVSYRLLISTSDLTTGGVLDDADVVFRADEIASSAYSVGSSARLVTNTPYYMQIVAIDSWGVLAPGAIIDTRPDYTNVPNGSALFSGIITTSGSAALPETGAAITWDSIQIVDVEPDGFYLAFRQAGVTNGVSGVGGCSPLLHYTGDVQASADTFDDSPIQSQGFCESVPPDVNFNLVESAAPLDSDGDLLPDAVEIVIGTLVDDPDYDNDGLSDFDEVNYDGDPTTYTPGVDLNPFVSDTDNDSVDDLNDNFPLDNTQAGDHDGDTIDSVIDDDDDGDTFLDINDLFPYDNTKAGDHDNDGVDSLFDFDDDADGVLDTVEVATGTDPLDAASFIYGDINADGLVNSVDVMQATQAITGTLTLDAQQFTRGDVAGGGSALPAPDTLFNAGDLVAIQRKALGLVSF